MDAYLFTHMNINEDAIIPEFEENTRNWKKVLQRKMS